MKKRHSPVRVEIRRFILCCRVQRRGIVSEVTKTYSSTCMFTNLALQYKLLKVMRKAMVYKWLAFVKITSLAILIYNLSRVYIVTNCEMHVPIVGFSFLKLQMSVTVKTASKTNYHKITSFQEEIKNLLKKKQKRETGVDRLKVNRSNQPYHPISRCLVEVWFH